MASFSPTGYWAIIDENPVEPQGDTIFWPVIDTAGGEALILGEDGLVKSAPQTPGFVAVVPYFEE